MGGSDAHTQILRLDKHSPSEAVFPAYLSGSYQPPLPSRRSSLPSFSLSNTHTHLNKFNHSNLPTISKACSVSGASAGLLSPCCVPQLTTHSIGAIFPAVVCTVLLSCLKPSLCSDSAVRLSIVSPTSLCHGHYTSHAHCQAGGCMHHDHFHTRCHFMSRPCSHTQLYCIIPLGHTLGLTLEPQAQEHTCHNTVSFPHVCVSDSHDITPVRRPSLTSEPHTTCLLSHTQPGHTFTLHTGSHDHYHTLSITCHGPMLHTL